MTAHLARRHFGGRRQGKAPGRAPRARRLALALPLLLGLAGCEGLMPPSGPPRESLRPVQRSAAVVPPEIIARSTRLRAYYRDELDEDLARGLMRQDGGGPEAQFDADDLARNFEKIAFFDEYRRGADLAPGTDAPGKLLRWQAPVRLRAVFGTSVEEAARAEDRATLRPLVRRLSRITGHPISMTGSGANFHVLVMGEADREEALAQVRRLVPNISSGTLNTLRALPRDIPCLVMGFADEADTMRYGTAIALVRAELPPLMREACFHEEIAQGLGLRNDSPDAQPSIFNDDATFALLTEQDELMLQMLYDPRLSPGMSLSEARPVITRIAAELRPAATTAAALPASAVPGTPDISAQ